MTLYKTVCMFLPAILLSISLRAEGTNATPVAAEANVAELKKEFSAADTNAAPKDAGAPSDPKFERYRTIMDRMPFGPEPANFNPDAPVGRGGAAGNGEAAFDPAAQEAMKSQEEQKILSSVRVSALNVTPSGKIAVGFTDASKQPAGNYYLKVGETRDGWTVKAADAHEMKVTLERDGVEATLGLGEGVADAGKDGKRGGGQQRPLVNRLKSAGLLQRPTSASGADLAAPAGGGSAIASLRARRAQKDAERKEEEARQVAAAEQARMERERAAAEREQQREALLQIQEELRRQREAKELQQNEEQQAAGQNVQE